MARALSLDANRPLGLPLGADEQDLSALGDALAHEVEGGLESRERLIQIDDVDAVALPEQERLHPRIPAPGLVSEMDTGLQQDANGQRFGFKGGGRRGLAAVDPGRLRSLSRGLGHRISPSRFCVRPGPCLPNPSRQRAGSSTAGSTQNV